MKKQRGCSRSFCWGAISRFCVLVAVLLASLFPSHNRVCGWKFRFPGRRKHGADAPPHESSNYDYENVSGRDKTTLLAGNTAKFVQDIDAFAETLAAAVDDAAIEAEERAKRFRFVVPQVVKTIYDKFISILLYKPPVGLVAVAMSARLLLTGRIFSLYSKPKNAVEDVMQKESRKREKERQLGRSLNLDPDDTAYNTQGGIQTTRRTLCWAALQDVLDKKDASAESALDDDDDESQLLLKSVLDALHVTNRPGGARVQFVQQVIQPLADLEAAMLTTTTSSSRSFSRKQQQKMTGGGPISAESLQKVLAIASLTAEVQAVDALLRVCRDRLLRTTYRLARTKEYWTKRAQSAAGMARLIQRVLRKAIEGDRMRLSYAKAAYNAEVTRLGEIASILMDRPDDMQESFLLQALKATEEASANPKEEEVDEKPKELEPTDLRMRIKRKAARWSLAKASRYSIRWRADGRGKLSIRRLDHTAGYIAGSCAVDALLSDETHDAWMEEARAWKAQARSVLCKVVRESLRGSEASSDFNEDDFEQLEQTWCSERYPVDTDIRKQWTSVLRYVDSLPSWRRVGEGKVVRLKDAAIVGWTRRLDVMGIPSSLLCVWAAGLAHKGLEKWFIPRWPQMRREMIDAAKKTAQIVRVRFWVPLKGIVDDIMNKNTGMMSAFGLPVEEASLDRMLRDLGFGDGSSEMRKEALKKATEQYEHDLRSGLFTNFLRGRLVRLLLVQVQQLKVGLLSALDTIDVLMEGNRIHFQVLAAIPAVIIVTFGTRIFLRGLYNIRAKDLRPIRVVHSEMKNYLNRMENLMMLSDSVSVSDEGRVFKGQSSPTMAADGAVWKTPLKPAELGELILNMHRYLILMDFTSPSPFPARYCDQIHANLREFLGTNGTLKRLDADRQLSWLKLVKQKHQDLLKLL